MKNTKGGTWVEEWKVVVLGASVVVDRIVAGKRSLGGDCKRGNQVLAT